MNKPSRSEIEQSLLGAKREIPARIDPSFEIPEREQTSRRKTVIGGNLQGVSRNIPKKNYLHWVLVAGFILLSGLIFIIPEFFSDAPKISQEQNQPVENQLYDNRIDEPSDDTAPEANTDSAAQQNLAESGFTVPKDRDRAAEYRESEQQVQQLNDLNEKAIAAVEAGNYTKPANVSALKYYKEMLSLNQNSVAATDGINAMLTSLNAQGADQVQEKDIDSAKQTLQTLSEIDIDSEEYFDLSDAIADAELAAVEELQKEQVNELIEKAKTALDKDRLVTPKNDNVALYLNQVLEIDAENTIARQGIDQISKQFAEQAEQHIVDREWSEAEDNINNLKIANKDSVLAAFLENRLDKAKKLPEPEPIIETPATDNIAANESVNTTQNNSALNNSFQETTSFPAPSNSIDVAVKPNTIDNTIPFANRQDSPAPADERSIAANSLPPTQSANTSAPVTDLIESQREAEIEANIEARNAQRQQLNLGLQAYYSGEYVTAYSNLAPLAENNVTRAQVRLGYMYQFGRGVTQDQAKGVQYLQTALPDLMQRAQANEAWAQSDLGSLYEDGIVVGQSNSTAIAWYRKAAAQNYAGAQTNLGNMYFFGKGVEQNQDEAIKWYRLAALEGDAIAKQNLIQLGAVSF